MSAAEQQLLHDPVEVESVESSDYVGHRRPQRNRALAAAFVIFVACVGVAVLSRRNTGTGVHTTAASAGAVQMWGFDPGSAMQQATDTAGNAATQLKEKAQDAAGNAANQLKEKAQEKAESAKDKAKALMQQAQEQVMGGEAQMWQDGEKATEGVDSSNEDEANAQAPAPASAVEPATETAVASSGDWPQSPQDYFSQKLLTAIAGLTRFTYWSKCITFCSEEVNKHLIESFCSTDAGSTCVGEGTCSAEEGSACHEAGFSVEPGSVNFVYAGQTTMQFQGQQGTEYYGYTARVSRRDASFAKQPFFLPESACVLFFRGINSQMNIKTFYDRSEVDAGNCDGCKTWHGFHSSWQIAKPEVLQALEKSGCGAHQSAKLFIAGHSMGGALTIEAVADLPSLGYDIQISYSFMFGGAFPSSLGSYVSEKDFATSPGRLVNLWYVMTGKALGDAQQNPGKYELYTDGTSDLDVCVHGQGWTHGSGTCGLMQFYMGKLPTWDDHPTCTAPFMPEGKNDLCVFKQDIYKALAGG